MDPATGLRIVADDNRRMKSIDELDGHVPLTGPAAAATSPWGLIRARGADAASFLHSQLTNDIASLGESEVRLAGYCSAKGRLLASFVVWRAGEDIVLACDHSLLAATLKRLSMFVLRARCRLSDATAELPVTGVVGASAAAELRGLLPWAQAHSGEVHRIRLPDAAGLQRGLLVGAAPAEGVAALPLGAWRWLEVQSAIPTIEAATADQFVPQMLNYETLGGVSFSKGCYPGQEVVARSQYRGTIKRRMFLFEFEAEGPAAPGRMPAAGDEVFHSADPGQPAGRVVNAAGHPFGRGSAALVEVKTALLSDGTLHLGSAHGASLVQRELPYPFTIDAESAA